MTPIPVGIWIDPGCPWAWQTGVWLRRLAADGVVELDWRLFSLELNALPDDTPFWEACRRDGEALVALALARREGGAAFEQLYDAIGRRLHDQKREPSLEMVREAAAAAGMPGIVDRAIGMDEIADAVRREYLDARQQSVFGVPTLQIADTKVLYGPILALAPEGEEGERLWEHICWLAERPDFFELKRWPRDVRPGQTQPANG